MALDTKELGGLYANITTGATTVLATSPTTLERIVVNKPGTTITATIYDGVNTSAPLIGTVALLAGVLTYGVQTNAGLTIVTSGTCDLTVVYR